MKTFLLALTFFSIHTFVAAQTAEEVIESYFETIGGIKNWENLKGVRMIAKVSAQGMDFPVNMVNMTDGKSILTFEFQGKEMVQQAYDGQIAWGMNFMTQKVEKSDEATTTLIKLESEDFPSPFLNYAERGVKIEMGEKETVEGTETLKLKLTYPEVAIDGEKMTPIKYYYFDAETFVPIMSEEEQMLGPGKGTVLQTLYSDYDEVDGLYFPFSLSVRPKGGDAGQTISIDKIEVNPEVSKDLFTFKEESGDQ